MEDGTHESRSYRPELSPDTVPELVHELYGLHVLSCRELDSYDDRNFHVRVDESRGARNDHLLQVWPHGYVLKVLNSLDSKRPEVIEAKNAMAITAVDQGFPTPRPVPSVSGQLSTLRHLVRETDPQPDTETEGADQKEVFLIRLMEYLPGTVLSSVTLTPHISFQVGQYAAKLDRMLKVIDDSRYPELIVNWNMQNVPNLRHLTHYIVDAHKANVVTEVIEAFETRVLKCQQGLQTGLIHSDFNDCNILVEPVENSGDPSLSPTMRVCGILDFGDATKSFFLIEIAIAMTYMTLMCPPDLDPDDISGHALAGYLSEMTLTKAELELIPLTMCARFSHSLTFGYHRKVLDPDNEYCLFHANKVWPHMQRLWSRPVHETLAVWRKVASSHGFTL